MAAYTWPIELPFSPRTNYSEDAGSLISRTPMDVGSPKMRLIGKRSSMLSVDLFMSDNQILILENFLFNTIKSVKRFNFPHPRTREVLEVRVVPSQDGKLYQSNFIDKGYFVVTLTLEVLP